MKRGMVVAALVIAGVAANGTAAADLAPSCTAWDRVSAPNNGKASALNAVDALDAVTVWAVGHDWNAADSRAGAPLAVRWSGSAWTEEPLPDLSHLGAQPALEAVHVAPTGEPWVVGRLTDGTGRPAPLVLQWSGGHWQAHPVVMLDSFAPRYAALRDVAALAGNDAWTVGQAETIAKGVIEPFAAHWDGSAWTEVFVPAAAGRNRTVTAVSAAAPDAVWAVGHDIDADLAKTASPRIFHWNGRQWVVVDHPVADKPNVVLLDVVALARNDVWAVGVIGADEGGVFLHWDGSVWTELAVPQSFHPRSIAGAASDDVWAVGSGGRSHWDGRGWTLVPETDSDRASRRFAVTVAGPCEAWTVSTWGVAADSASLVERLGPSLPVPAPPLAPAPPPTPVDFKATPKSVKEIALEWKSGEDPTGAIAGSTFVIERCIGEAADCATRFVAIVKLNGKATSFLDSGLTPATAYTYRILAVNDGGSSAPTSPTTALTLAEQDPSPLPLPIPSGGSPGSVAVPAEPDARAASEPASSATVAYAPAPSAQFAYEPRPAPPATPKALAAAGVSVKAIALSWQPVVDPTGAIGTLTYVVERCIGEAGACWTRLRIIVKLGGKTTSFVDSGLEARTPYTYRVFAVNDAGKSEPTAPVTAFTLGAGAPSPLPVPAGSSTTSEPRQ